MSDAPTPYVNPGDDLIIYADDWNSFVDAANDFKRVQGGTNHGDRGRFDFQGETFYVKNTGSTGISRFYPVILTQPVIAPTDNFTGFANEIVFKAKAPDGTLPGVTWGIMQEPVAANAFGRCKAVGLTVAYLTVASTTDQFAQISTTGTLVSNSFGDAEIVWLKGWETGTKTATTTGAQWALIQLGVARTRRVGFIGGSDGGVAYVEGIDVSGPSWTYKLYWDQALTQKIADNVTVSPSAPSRFASVYANAAPSGSRCEWSMQTVGYSAAPVILELDENTLTQEWPS